jgi:hypothetical protein
LSRLIL